MVRLRFARPHPTFWITRCGGGIGFMNCLRMLFAHVVLSTAIAFGLAALLPTKIAIAAESEPSLAQALLAPTDEQRATLSAGSAAGVLEIAPVNLPVDPPGDCNHFGWPIATMVGDTLVVMHRRIPGHNPRGAGGPHEKMSYGIVLRSDDGGETWSPPYDLRDSMLPADRLRGGIVPLSHRFKFEKDNKSTEGYKIHLHALGTTRDGGVVAINNHGVFRSDDEGRTWSHFSEALRDDTFPHDLVNIGPKVIDHPELGLTVFGNWFGTAAGPKKSDQLVVLQSPDGGATWNVASYDAGFEQYEPAALLWGEKFLLITRDQTTGNEHRQMSWSPGSELVVTATNLQNPRLIDTVDFSFNPVTERFEMVRSERHHMELWLWSMAPEEWSSGKWKRECRLLAREGKFYSTADGFHPASAVIDRPRGVQHIFIYCGHPNGPAGVFRITRTLDTPQLVKVLSKKSASIE